ncbi:uncharacterized protein BO80DRAFT_107280 [Aspergillus ibericus CBS 121593]|uniref:Uncharacterized protein n=1 Tax=Aspergillus ibericus CBS 121593 TaxID=1448316 RepID=A0A395H1H5_9EURO|nr:hypothetical protein BO80DRAFT_107280 [Aspergillus ibericus CBS 121593]RAL00064.1 hypothetical protein BO80DRAFT_107280 [Aspergillus ibericus CBS 121593]
MDRSRMVIVMGCALWCPRSNGHWWAWESGRGCVHVPLVPPAMLSRSSVRLVLDYAAALSDERIYASRNIPEHLQS